MGAGAKHFFKDGLRCTAVVGVLAATSPAYEGSRGDLAFVQRLKCAGVWGAGGGGGGRGAEVPPKAQMGPLDEPDKSRGEIMTMF